MKTSNTYICARWKEEVVECKFEADSSCQVGLWSSIQAFSWSISETMRWKIYEALQTEVQKHQSPCQHKTTCRNHSRSKKFFNSNHDLTMGGRMRDVWEWVDCLGWWWCEGKIVGVNGGGGWALLPMQCLRSPCPCELPRASLHLSLQTNRTNR